MYLSGIILVCPVSVNGKYLLDSTGVHGLTANTAIPTSSKIFPLDLFNCCPFDSCSSFNGHLGEILA